MQLMDMATCGVGNKGETLIDLLKFSIQEAHCVSSMARHCDFVFVVAVTCLLRLAFGQEQILLQNAKQNNLVDIQFFADANFQQTRTPFAYFDFPAIQQGSCTQCEDFQVCSSCLSILLILGL